METRNYRLGIAAILVLPWLLWGVNLMVRTLVAPGFANTQESLIRFSISSNPKDSIFWIIIAIQMLLACALSIFARIDSSDKEESESNAHIAASTILGLMCVGCLIVIGWKSVQNRDQVNFPNEATTFVVADLENPPDSLERLLEGAHQGDGETCELIGKHDVHSCVTEGSFPEEGWENRSASFAGAVRVMGQTSGDSQKVELLSETVVHIYPEQGEVIASVDDEGEGYWTGIRDGSGKHTPTESVVEWDGRNPVTTCEFEGDFELNRALRGDKSKDMRNLIYEDNPGLRYHLADVYGYCDKDDNDQPVIVVPLYDTVIYGSRHVDVPAGIVLVRGSPSGDPQFQRMVIVQPGEIPGPVYPVSFAEMQRESQQWAAGRKYKENEFGYEPTSATSQADNATEFLLRSRDDGRSYWVTPLTTKGSDSQLVVAYTVIPADSVDGGNLNPMTVFVLTHDDDRVINIDQMERNFRDYVSRENPGFFSAGGKLQEFTPAADGTWRAFGVLDGDPRFIIEIDPAGTNRPVVTELYASDDGTIVPEEDSGEPSEPGEGTSSDACDLPLDELSDSELFVCIQAALEELEQRGTTTEPTPVTEEGGK